MAVWSVVKSSFVINSSRIDGEYFKPKYLDILNKLNRYEPLSKYVTEFIHPGEFKRIYSKQGVSVLRAQNVRPLKIDINENDELFLQEEIANKLTKNFLQFGDILITRTGANYGQTALFTNERKQAIVTSHTFIVRVRDINSAYLALFLNTDLGIKQIEQGMYGSSQPEIAPKFLKRILVPRFEYDIEEQISKDVLKAYELRQQSQTLYKEAEKLLEKELGLDGLEFEKPRSYTAKLSEVYSHNRFDSEHFKPKYFQLKELIRNYTCGYESLTSHVNYLKPNINPHSNPTQDYNYIELSGINASLGIVENSEKLKGRETPSRAKRVVQSGDLLVSSVVGSVEKVALVSDDEDGFLASTGFFHFQSDFYTSEYLLILMKSKIIKEQLFQESTGGILSAVSDSNLKNIIIPIVDETIRNEIALKVKKSHKALKQSKQLLEDAKAKVEALIEEASR